MKCVKDKAKVVTRVDDAVAVELVKTGTHVYASKMEWRATDPAAYKQRQQTQVALEKAAAAKKAAKEAGK